MKHWKYWFQPHILERGQVYFDEGRVSELERTEDGYAAIVEGTEEYEVGDPVGGRLRRGYAL